MNQQIVTSPLASSPHLFTKEGLETLKHELEDLKDKKRPGAIDRVARARDFGDLSENTEYANAREELSFIEGRIEELEELLSKARLIKKVSPKASNNKSEVKLGCRVTVKGNGVEHVFIVVGEWEADPSQKKISHNSPLGKALLGKKVGEKTEVEAPAGKVVYLIKRID